MPGISSPTRTQSLLATIRSLVGIGVPSSDDLTVEQNATVPGLVGLGLEQAQAALTDTGLKVGATASQTTLRVANGTVLVQNVTADTAVAPGAAVDLVVERNVVVPGVEGLLTNVPAVHIREVGLSVTSDGTCTSITTFAVIRGRSPLAGPRGPRSCCRARMSGRLPCCVSVGTPKPAARWPSIARAGPTRRLSSGGEWACRARST